MYPLAEVIVDVPTMQTDQPFTYLIPADLQPVVKKGMRVEVPFGNGNRHIQGFVVDISETKTLDERLKPIVRLLDIAPVLNTELLALADYMKETTYAFKITCLQTMLPSVMKAEYKKTILLVDKKSEAAHYFPASGEIDYDEAQKNGHLPKLMKFRQAGIVDIRYEVHNKNRVKTVRMVKALVDAKKAEKIFPTLRKGSLRKAQLLEILAAQKEELPVKYFTALGLTTAHLNQGAKDGWLELFETETYRDPFAEHEFETTTNFVLNEEQEMAVAKILAAYKKKQAETFLLEGITGSGKTEVYLQAIQQVLKEDKTAMMLVPEIALTPQMVERFKSRLGDAVAVLHSGLSQGERYDEWRKIERGEAQVVVGARSAIFAPLENIGLIIVDEEHEATYKQEEAPRYHARDLAIWRSRYHKCPVILGSATPSLESRARAQKKVYTLLPLQKRANPNANLPTIEIVDLKDEYSKGNMTSFSLTLQEKMQDRLAKNEQIVLLLNRRGYSSFMMCRDCGYVLDCPNCDISLTLHMDTKTMRCHYCGHEEAIPHKCPECGSKKISYYGTGTQKVEAELQELLPEARILRMDVDTTRKKGAHEKILTTFGEKKADILLGTQMIAKGLDFPDITLVGVLNADTALNLPDFRSSERTFQLLTQVSGRAGRAQKAGEVVIQTFNPEHYAISLAKAQDYERFYQQEMRMRHQAGYPPYYFTVKLTVSHETEVQAAQKSFQLARQLQAALSPNALLLGPTPSAIMRIKNRYYYQIIIKYKNEPALKPLLEQILDESQIDQKKGLYVSIDNEPLNFI
ncbi:primosomal protein N' [Enterococcus sp. MJM12]|uniref:Replication restart protein PriA n=1 Tax=Candidatus Enterococcus myersii TaxID=2815322 RepID=A0ABS3H4G8_9ENTE|nr:primosomal protein N' [Enterococcus sp. MJM12]MBO0448361.1 primosomal protein N' [Enterococcus sp. MJM12]